jgi:hypothetical protein
MTSTSASASASASGSGSGTSYIPQSHSTSHHRVHPPPSTIHPPLHSQSTGNSQHRIHPPPYQHPYASGGVYYLAEPVWTQPHPQPLDIEQSNPWHTDGLQEHEDGHLIGHEHEVTPHPVVSYMYPTTQPLPLPLTQTQSLPNFKHQQQHGPIPLANKTNIFTPARYEYEEGEDEISPALSRRVLGEVDTPSVIDPELDDEILEELEEDEYQPASAQRKKGKGRASGVKKGKGKGKAIGKGKGKAKGRPRSSAAKQPRTTIRGEVRPAPSIQPRIGDTQYDTYDTDSHINTSYFPGLKNITYPLLAAPEGTFLDVNDLLILHPPALNSDDSHVTVNQYNKEVDTRDERWLAEMGKSKFEMYTCRGCRKTYDGKNARSVARRHLQDKHGIPLSQQARRTRWDIGMFFPSFLLPSYFVLCSVFTCSFLLKCRKARLMSRRNESTC